MPRLKIIEDIREELTSSGIVICTYKDLQGNEFDGIDMLYQAQYPDLEVVESIKNNVF